MGSSRGKPRRIETSPGQEMEPVAQRQEMVSGTLSLLSGLPRVAFHVSRALAPKGYKVCTSIHPLLKGCKEFLGAPVRSPGGWDRPS